MPKKAELPPSFLNYNRSISPSEGLLFGMKSDGSCVPVEVIKRGVRGAISSYANVYKEKKVESSENIAKQLDPKNANLQQIEVAFLPQDAERLALRFSVVVQNNSFAPAGCDDPEFHDKLAAVAARYAEIGGYMFLAERYAWNLINGRVLWRNRFVTEKRVKIALMTGEEFTFNVDNMRLDRFEREAMPDGFEVLAGRIGTALAGENPLFLDVEVSGKAPAGAEVFPSQEFLPEAKTSKDKGKVLSSINVDGIRQATMHSQKIGNAIRVIDEWHGKVEDYGAIAVEAFGYVQSRTDAVRLPGKNNGKDIYALLKEIDDVIEALNASDDASSLNGDIHYMVAMLVRGGVFSGEKKKKKAA